MTVSVFIANILQLRKVTIFSKQQQIITKNKTRISYIAELNCAS